MLLPRPRTSQLHFYNLMLRIVILTVAISAAQNAFSQEPKKAKYALLVGVDDYAQPSDPAAAITPLKGPGNDVALIKDLLTKYYEFPDTTQNIISLVGKSATREAITQHFRTHLIENAKKHPDAIFVFYFSGHGSQTADLNGDEGDGDDETLVAYDSRSDKGRDIVDDEIAEWLDELKQHAKNISVIIDSCHSGSATKGTLGTAVARRVGRDSRPRPIVDSAQKLPATDKAPGALLERDKRLSVISAAQPEESSYEDEIETPTGKRYHGFLTYNLVQVLSRNPDLTYEQAVRELEPGLRRQSPGQHPQAEGDIDRVIFAGSGRHFQPFIALTSIDGTSITIAAGAAHGLREGGILAIYSPKAKSLTGEAEKLANARLTSIEALQSRASILDTPKSSITAEAKVKVITAFPASEKIAVGLPPPEEQPGSATKEVFTSLRGLLNNSKLARIANASQQPFVFADVQCVRGDGLPNQNAQQRPCTSTYSLFLRGSTIPLYDLKVVGKDPSDTAATLLEGIESLAKQESVRALENAASPYRDRLTVSLVKVDAERQQDGKLIVKGESEVVRSGIETISIGKFYRFKIVNASDKDLYVAVVWLGTSGRIGLLDPSGRGELIQAGRSMMTSILQAGRPPGLETYKIIATTDRKVNFRTLEQPGTSKDVDVSPLSWLLNQSVNTGFRDPEVAKNLDADAWTTARIDIRIRL